MQKPIARPNAPKRCGAHHVYCSLASVLNNPITCADVMQRKVAERVDYFVAQSRRHREGSTVDGGSRSASCRHKVGKCHYVVAIVLRICNRIEWCSSAIHYTLGSATRVLELAGI